MDPVGTLHDFWRQRHPDGNVPEDYLNTRRSELLLPLIEDLPLAAKILEVGCNIGRNLAYLHDHGYENLAGVEISPHAVDLLRVHHPQLEGVPIHVGPAEDELDRFADKEFDLVFTMAVLEHIHPDSRRVIDNIVRCGRHVLTVEPGEGSQHRSHRRYAWDLRAEFAARGMRLASSRPIEEIRVLGNDETDLRGYVASRFESG